MIDRFGIGAEGTSDLVDSLWILIQLLSHFRLQLQQFCCRFLASFNPRLIVSINVYQRTVKADGTFIQGDQCPDRERTHIWHANGDGFALLFEQSLAGPTQKPVQIIATAKIVLYFHRRGRAVLLHFNKGDKEIENAIAQLLHIGMLISRSFIAINGDSLMHNFAVAVLLLS